MQIKCLIVDDEPLAQRVVEKYMADLPELVLVKKCNDAIEARDVLFSEEIDLMFLDINMPKLTGLTFLKTLKNPPLVIITTAYREYALEGFELDVVDYLNKPFSFERFLNAINKVTDRIQSRQKQKVKIPAESPQMSIAQAEEAFIFVKSDKITYKVDHKDILYIESVGDYVKIITDDKSILSYQSLKKLEEILPAKYFPRIHKSFIISVSRIDSIEGNQIKIKDITIPIGRNYKQHFQDIISSFGG
ncbi:MAG: response regulator transcription factor [Bacteroidales bacterium]|nr:response regulator transcription factor [Bacteroidales bacterium]